MAQRLLLSIVAVIVCSTTIRGDLTLVAVEYRVLNDLGQVRLRSTYVPEGALQSRMVKERAQFDHRGVVLIQGETSRVFTRTERIDRHVVETKLAIEPAVGHGYRGGLPTANVMVTVDGKPRLDLPYDEGVTELHDILINVRDGIIRIQGSVKDKPFDQMIPLLDDGKLVDFYWLMALPQ